KPINSRLNNTMSLTQQVGQGSVALPSGNQGISSPAGTHQQETTVSKERRHIIGNLEAQCSGILL
ncbi:hypothetical protein, partial [Pectobacterium versatile]|uniref:hypothetical protein n=1 Tax=Pectobacterium versatile TaxID=2488639 RepID=UPI00195F369C